MIEKMDLIESYNEYLEKIPAGLNYIIERLRNSEISEALNAIVNFSEGLIWIEDAVTLLRKNDVQVYFEIDKIESFLDEINQGIEKQDFFLVADIFEYEIFDFFVNLQKIKEIN